MADDERLALRYAVAAEAGQGGPEFIRDAAYAGPHLLMVSGGAETVSANSPGKLAIENLRELDRLADTADLAASLEEAIDDLQGTFRELLAADPYWQGITITLTAMLVQNKHLAIGHIGDARVYRLRDNELAQLTRDHTLGQVLIEEGMISPAELGADRKHSFLVQWIDGERSYSVETSLHEMELGDRYVLITGRVDHFISPTDLHDILRDSSRSPEDVVDTLMGEAFPVGRGDGFACIAADVLKGSDPDHDEGVKLAGAALR